MEEITAIVKVDTSGRMVLPAKVRQAAGLENEVALIASRGEVILRPARQNNQAVEEWYRQHLNTRLPIGKAKPWKYEEKWMSEEYAKRKLGL